MTRLIFKCFFFLTLSIHCYGQNFRAGLITGVSTSQVSGDQLGGFNKLGIKFGASVNHYINSASRGQLALYYIDKGSNDVNSDFKIDLSYIETSWCIQKTSKGFIYEAGLLFGVLVDGKTYDIYGYEDLQKNDFHGWIPPYLAI